jgi:HlyD family secretion protein
MLDTIAQNPSERPPATAATDHELAPAQLHPVVTNAEAREHKRLVARYLRRGIFTLAGLAVVAGAVLALRPQPVPVETVRALRGPLTVAIDESGSVRVKDRYLVAAPVTGTLGRIAFEVGDTVKAGTTVAELAPVPAPLLDPRSRAQAEARLGAALSSAGQAGAQVSRARAAKDQAELEFGRTRQLNQSGAVTDHALDQAAFEARIRGEELESALFGQKVGGEEVRLARAALGRSGDPAAAARHIDVTAPVSGKILRIQQKSATVVAAGTVLLEIGDDAGLEVVVDLLTTDAVKVQPGSRVVIHDWGGADLAARVHRIEPSAFTRISALGVEEQRVNVVIALDEPRLRWAALSDGFRVEARIVVAEVERALTLPMGAIFRSGNRWAVFRVEAGQVHLTPIEIGHRAEAQIEVTNGLAEGSEVVLHPGDRIRTGVRVRQDDAVKNEADR